MRRVLKGDDTPGINPAGDIYNAVGRRWLVPVGAEDLAQVVGRLRLFVAAGGELFDLGGGGESADRGELGGGAGAGSLSTCRRSGPRLRCSRSPVNV